MASRIDGFLKSIDFSVEPSLHMPNNFLPLFYVDDMLLAYKPLEGTLSVKEN